MSILFKNKFKRKEFCFLLGDFSADLLKYDKPAGTNEFLDSLTSCMFLLYILHPTKVTGHSQTIHNNIFSNYILKETVCTNLNSITSDDLPQVLFIPSMSLETPATKSSTVERSWTNLNQAELWHAIWYWQLTKILPKLEHPVLKIVTPSPCENFSPPLLFPRAFQPPLQWRQKAWKCEAYAKPY